MKFYLNWIVLGPMRSGTGLVARALSKYRPYRIRYYRDPTLEPRRLFIQELIHTHNLNWLEFVTNKTRVIFTVRNPIRCALSKCILPKLGVKNNQPNWHFYTGDEQVIADIVRDMKPFHLDIEQFKKEVTGTDNFYKQIMHWPKWKDYSIIEYESWDADPSLMLPQLGLDNHTPDWYLKNPGTPEQWISNFDEIMDYSRSVSLENYLRICQRN